MATIPPTEVPAQPSEPGIPETAPPEVGPNAPDIDVPTPQPGGDPVTTPASPVD